MPTLRQRLAEAEQLNQQLSNNEALLRENVRDLELALEDEGWQRFGQENANEFTRSGLKKILAMCRLMFLKNPLINRAVTLQAVYVWAQGVTIGSKDESTQKVIQAFLDDEKNQSELTSHQARTMKEQDLQVLGNLFFIFFTELAAGTVRLRSIAVNEIEDIITNPEDSKDPWLYKRVWVQSVLDEASGKTRDVEFTAYYPDLRYDPADRPQTIGGKPVMWDTPVYHVRVGGLSDMRFGLPEVYQALDWARAYKSFLEDWASIVRAYARFAWNLKTTGGQKAVASAKSRFGTTLGVSGSSETNPPSNIASTFISSGADMTPMRTAGATTSAEDGRRLLLMVCAAVGMPETFFGDVSTGNLATAKSLDRPTELKFRDRQELWKHVLHTILRYVVAKSKGAASGGLRMVADADTSIDISFPPILEHDIAEQMAAIVQAATLDGKSLAGTITREEVARLVLTALGVENVEDMVEMVFEPEPAVQPAASPKMAEALRGLREAIIQFQERAA